MRFSARQIQWIAAAMLGGVVLASPAHAAHICEGVLPPVTILVLSALAVGGCALGLIRLNEWNLPIAAVLGSVFFLASLVHVPIGPSSVHLLMNGLCGLLLGWTAFPVLLAALILQSVFFGFGGMSVLGVNTFNMAMPAVAAYLLYGRRLQNASSSSSALMLGGLAGATSVILTVTLVALSVHSSGSGFLYAARTQVVAHVPVMVIEAIVTGFAASFLYRVRPALLKASWMDESLETVYV